MLPLLRCSSTAALAINTVHHCISSLAYRYMHRRLCRRIVAALCVFVHSTKQLPQQCTASTTPHEPHSHACTVTWCRTLQRCHTLLLWRLVSLSVCIHVCCFSVCRHIDTAQFYANEADCGEAVRAAADAGITRDQVWITSKVSTNTDCIFLSFHPTNTWP